MARAKKKDKKVLYPTLTAIPRCKVGDCVFRQTLIGQYEEAMIVSILSQDETSDSWSGTLMTKNGVEYIAGYVEHRTIHDWMPIGWVYDNEAVGWWPPASILRDDSKDAVIEDPHVAAEEDSETIFAVPTPWEGEKFMSWQSRVLKSVPAIKGTDAIKTQLSDAWKQKNYEITV